jgi:hypothetical protein
VANHFTGQLQAKGILMTDLDLYLPGSAAPRVAPAAGGAPRLGGLAALLARIEEAVETETSSIRQDPHFDLKSSNARKSRYLYELNKALKSSNDGHFAALHSEDISRLREKLAANEAAIKAHLSAVREVADLLQDAIQKFEADGTYDGSVPPARPA